ncbi:hypothetical protein [Tritonibacter mobilis]|uniref:hypothetical protein n=1 Tax=Tritonibacter mobilis TaxID=379347 RepID=UPI0013A5AD77|nr:hypothetical protein [Tritonibacter mobilis]
MFFTFTYEGIDFAGIISDGGSYFVRFYRANATMRAPLPAPSTPYEGHHMKD